METAERPILVPAPGSAPTVIQVPENKIMTDVSVFRTIARVDLGLPNSYLHNLTAGHRYPTSNASAWERAWCYADFRKNGLNYKVDIEERTPITRLPIPLSPNERQELGLSDNDIAYLRARCPWR